MALEQPKKVTGGAFGRYMAEHRAAILKELPGKPATASVKLGSERFKALSASERQKYEKQYAEAKQQYEKDMADFLAEGGEKKTVQRKGKKEKNTKDPNKPKKPAGGAYGCYLEKHRAAFVKECEGKPITAVSKLAGARWKALSDAEKKPFEEAYQKKKAAYEAAMKDYVPPAGEAAGDDEEGDDDDEGEEDATGESPAKKRKTTAADADGTAAKAKKLGYVRQYKSLMEDEKVQQAGASPMKVLEALKAGNGKAVAAKQALLGA